MKGISCDTQAMYMIYSRFCEAKTEVPHIHGSLREFYIAILAQLSASYQSQASKSVWYKIYYTLVKPLISSCPKTLKCYPRVSKSSARRRFPWPVIDEGHSTMELAP